MGHYVKRAQIRCVRCQEALTPWAPFEGTTISVELPEGATDGPCISPLDGSVEVVHRFVFAHAQDDGVEIHAELERDESEGPEA